MTLLMPWVWVGLAILVAAIAGAWFSSHAAPDPLASRKPGAPPETKFDHAEFRDD